MSSSSSLTSTSASTPITLVIASFLALFLFPYVATLTLKLVYSDRRPARSNFHRSYYPKAIFALPAISSLLYGVGGIFSLAYIARYTQDGEESSLERGDRIAQTITQAMGRFGAILCLLILLSTFGPRSNRRSSRAHLAPFTTIVVTVLFVLALASLVLSIYLSFASRASTTGILRVLSIVQAAIHLSILLSIIMTFILLTLLFRGAAAISRPDHNRGSLAEESLADQAAEHGVRPVSTATFPPPRLVRHLHYSLTISRIATRIIVWTAFGLVAAGLQFTNRLLNRDLLDPLHILLLIISNCGEVYWIGEVMYIFFGLCAPRPRTERAPPNDDEDDPASDAQVPPSSSGNHLLHTRSPSQAAPSSPLSQGSHNFESSPPTTHPHTPATPAIPTVPDDEPSTRPAAGYTLGHTHPHDNRRGSALGPAGTALAHPEPGATIGLEAGDGVGGRSIPATISEEFLYLCGDDPFSSPPPGTLVLPRVPSGGFAKTKKGGAVGKVKTEASRPTTSPMDPTPKSKFRPKRSSSDDVLSDSRKIGGDDRAVSVSNSGSGPSSKKARTSVEGAHNGGKLSKRPPAKPTVSRRSSTKRRRSGGIDKSKKRGPGEEMADVAMPLGDAPSVVTGTTRSRPPRSPIPAHLHPTDAFGQITSKASRQEETNSLGLIVHDHQVVPGQSTSRQDTHQSAFTALTTTTHNDDEGLLKSVLLNALALKRHQQVQYLDPTAALLPHDVSTRANHGVGDGQGVGMEERDHPSGSTTPTPQAQEDAGPTPRGGSPIGKSNGQPPLQAAGQKQFKFTTLVASPVSTGSESGPSFHDPTIYQRATAFGGPTTALDASAASLESFPRTPSLADAAMSITSLPSASELQNQLTPSPDDKNAFRFKPPSSFEPSAPIDIPETKTRARNHYRRRAPSASILEAVRAIPLASSPSNDGAGPGRGRLHKPNSSSYDSARTRARVIMAGVEFGFHPRVNERRLEGRISGDGSMANALPRGGPTGIEVLPGHPHHRHHHHGDSPPPTPPLGQSLLVSRFSDPTTTGTRSSGGTTSSIGGSDAGSESSFK